MSVLHRVEIHPEKVRQTTWHGYVARFLLGGVVTAMAGLLGTMYGPLIGGLFLGFPSIAVASLTLVEKHHGKNAVGADAWGACIGSAGLLVFGVIIWLEMPHLSGWLVLLLALGSWLTCSILLWLGIWQMRLRRHRKVAGHEAGHIDTKTRPV